MARDERASVNGQHRAFYARGELGASDDDGDLDQAFFFRVEPGHFTVKPDKILVGFFELGIKFVHVDILADGLN